MDDLKFAEPLPRLVSAPRAQDGEPGPLKAMDVAGRKAVSNRACLGPAQTTSLFKSVGCQGLAIERCSAGLDLLTASPPTPPRVTPFGDLE
jgi:hypothetical protein